MYQPTTRSKIAGDASLAGEDPLDTKLGHKDGYREKYLNQSHAQNCRRRLTRRAETHSITKLGQRKGPGRYASTGHTPKTARDTSLGGQTPTQSTNMAIRMGPGRYVETGQTPKAAGDATLGGQTPTRSPNWAKIMGPGRYNSTVHTLNTAGDASLGVQRPT